MLPPLRGLAVGACAIALAACASAPAKPPAPRPAGSGTVEVTTTGFKSEEGQLLAALFLDESGWPGESEQAFAAIVVPIREGRAVATFEDVPAGPFAVSVFHDEDLDRELDRGVFGIPKEPYGFSRDARSTFGPASFEDSRLELAGGETLQITIRVE